MIEPIPFDLKYRVCADIIIFPSTNNVLLVVHVNATQYFEHYHGLENIIAGKSPLRHLS